MVLTKTILINGNMTGLSGIIKKNIFIPFPVKRIIVESVYRIHNTDEDLCYIMCPNLLQEALCIATDYDGPSMQIVKHYVDNITVSGEYKFIFIKVSDDTTYTDTECRIAIMLRFEG